MEYPKKVWVIDVPLPFPFGNAQIRREGPALPPPNLGGNGSKDEPKGKKRRRGEPKEVDPAAHLHSRWHLVFAYVLGPLYPLLTRWSFGNIVWALLGLAATGACAALVLYRKPFLLGAEDAGLGLVQLVGGVALVILIGFTAWARALAIAGWRMQRRTELPIRHPLLVTALGLAAPGSGLFLSGHPRRGALAFWMLGPLSASAIVLFYAPWLWQLNQQLTAGRIPRSALEAIFMAAALLALAVVLGWFVQAMDGARHVSRATGRASHGQPVAAALLVALVAFACLFKPGEAASTADRFAVAFRLEGLRVVPLALELSAAKLDPSEPIYSYRAAELYDRLGQRDRARALRQELEAHWTTYARAIERTAQASRPRPVVSPPISFPPLVVPGIVLPDQPVPIGPPQSQGPVPAGLTAD